MTAKKVLFIDARKGGDFTLDALFAGLVDRLGFENVVDWPASEKRREGIPKVTGDIEKDYGAERRSLCYTPFFNKLKPWTLSEVNNLIRSGEIDMIFIDERQESFELYAHTIAHGAGIPVVVVAGHDRFWNDSPQALFQMYGRNLKAMFLDNWRENYRSLKNTYPMSYSTNFDHFWNVSKRDEYISNKLYNVCFMGYNSHGDRAVIVDHLLQKYGGTDNCLFVEKRPNTMQSFIRKEDYFKKMAQSKICINLKGGAECGKALRFYEIPYVGSYMLSQADNANQVHPFEDGVHCDYFRTVEDLDHLIGLNLDLEGPREKIAKAGHEHAMKFHTARARVDYIYGCIDGSR